MSTPVHLSESLELLEGLTWEEKEAFIGEMTDEEAIAFLFDADVWRRPDQHPPTGTWWLVWLVMAGRGWGKTFAGATLTNERGMQKESLGGGDIIVVGRTYDEVRKIQIEGPSGILKMAAPGQTPEWMPGNGRGLLVWPSGVRGIVLSADKPETCEGWNAAFIWADELGKWQYPEAAWKKGLQLCLRIGPHPHACVTTTPTPHETMCELEDREGDDVVITRGTTYANRMLSPRWLAAIERLYKGTRLGEQMIGGKLLRDNPRALWSSELIEGGRVKPGAYPTLVRIVVAIDPAGSTDDKKHQSNMEDGPSETGIVVAGVDARGHAYPLEDLSLTAKPDEWGRVAVAAYHRWQADAIVGEVNYGGDMVEHVIRVIDKNVNFEKVHATRGKLLRAEPVAALYEQGRAHHVGHFPVLELQMVKWQPGLKSPDRLDALVWALYELILKDDVEELDAASAYGA